MDIGNLADLSMGMVGGSASVGAVARWYFSRVCDGQQRQITQLATRLADLEEKRLARVEAAVSTLGEDGCKAGAVVHAKMETLIAQSNELLGGMHQLQRESAAQTEQLAMMDRSASKLWEKFDDHRQHHPGKTAGG